MSKDDDLSFIEELVKQLQRENDATIDENLWEKMRPIKESSLHSIDNAEYYACILYFIGFNILYTKFFKDIFEWFKEAYGKFDNSTVLKFLYRFVIDHYHQNKDQNGFWEIIDPVQDLNSSDLFIEVIKKNDSRIITLQEKYLECTKYLLKEHPKLREIYSNIVYQHIPQQDRLNFFKSSLYAEFVNYLIMLNLKEKAIRTVNEAYSIYKDNALVLALRASLTENCANAEKMFRRSLDLVEFQFRNQGLLQIKAICYSGLAYIYNKRELFDKADEYYSKGLELEVDKRLKDIIKLDRGRNSLDEDDLIHAKEIFEEVISEANMPNICASGHNNLGLIFYKKGLYEKAESEFIQAIDIKFDLPHPYYNLGVLYNEEGDKERAKKFFKTVLSMDRNFKEAREALKKIEASEVKNISDWFEWWFGAAASKLKKSIFLILFIMFGFLLGVAVYVTVTGKSVTGEEQKELTTSTFGIIGIILFFLILPIVSKLKVGPVELEMESKGEPTPKT